MNRHIARVLLQESRARRLQGQHAFGHRLLNWACARVRAELRDGPADGLQLDLFQEAA